MTWGAALPDHEDSDLVESEEADQQSSSILTLIVPAPNGCNLSCPFCYIQQRKENAKSIDISPKDYVRFISDADNVSFICIQGYEPLLPDSFAYTQEILAVVLAFPLALSPTAPIFASTSRPCPNSVLHALQ